MDPYQELMHMNSSRTDPDAQIVQRILEGSFGTLAGLTAVLIGLAIFYIRNRWTLWFDKAANAAYKQCDADSSGEIDKHELYTGVLWLYLKLNEKGLRCTAPTRAFVEELLESCDKNASGTLDYHEFKQVVRLLSAQTLARALTQVNFLLLCPAIAVGTCRIVSHTPLPALVSANTPRWLQLAAGLLPASVAPLAISSSLMLMLPVFLSLIDARAERAVQNEKARQLRSSSIAREDPDYDASDYAAYVPPKPPKLKPGERAKDVSFPSFAFFSPRQSLSHEQNAPVAAPPAKLECTLS
tara:strand:+ start:84 stop:977 length:894 start_codon:yes stop_codon:yes gene_type:complete